MLFLEQLTPTQANRVRWLLLSAWTILAIGQSAFTELAHDEAYYWLYSQNLDWGFMHQPPMVGALVWLGYKLIPMELGVRLLTVFMSTGTLFLTENLVGKKNPALFYAVAFAIPLLHVQSFFVAPDIPLMFFTAVFLNLLKKYIETDRLVLALGLGFTSALMMYSKYHAGLTLLASAIACISLVKRPSSWLVPVICGILLIPHINWQIDHQFISFKFHWMHRMAYPFNLELILSYIGGVALVLGPLVVFYLFKGFLLGGESNMFDRTLRYVGWLFLLFFLFQSFRGRVEPNWISTAIIPMLVLSVRYLENVGRQTHRTVLRLSSITVVLMLPLRVGLMANELPAWLRVKDEFHGWKDWSEQLHERVGGHPLVFTSNYRLTSKYAFYSGGLATSLNSPLFGGNDFDRFSMSSKINDHKGILVHGWPGKHSDTIQTPSGGKLWLSPIDRIRLYNDIQINVMDLPDEFVSNDTVAVNLEFVVRSSFHSEFEQGDVLTCEFYNKKKELLSAEYVLDLNKFKIDSRADTTVKFRVPDHDGTARMFFAIKPKEFLYGMNQFYHQIQIQPEPEVR